MIAADLGRMAIVLCMLLVRSSKDVWMVYPLLVAETLLAAFFEPARNAVIPNIVEKEEVVLANTLSSTTWSINLMLGATVGGVVAALLGRDAVFVLNAGFVSGFGAVDSRDALRRAARGWRPPLARPRTGGLFARARRHPLRALAGAAAFHDPGEGRKPDHRSGLGLVYRHGTAGISSALARARSRTRRVSGYEPAAWRPRAGRDARPVARRSVGRAAEARLEIAIFWDISAPPRAMRLLGVAGHLWQACLCVALAHVGSSLVWVFSTTLLQLQSDDKFRGRVFAADLGLCMFTIAAGAYLAGRFVDWGFAARHVASVAGALVLIPAALWGLSVRRNSEASV